MVLANAIDRALYLQTDLEGAFNGVNKKSLETRLHAKGITAAARRWIANFMDGRFANIGPIMFYLSALDQWLTLLHFEGMVGNVYQLKNHLLLPWPLEPFYMFSSMP